MKFRVSRRVSLLLLFGFSTAHANFVGNDTDAFNPTPDGLDFVTVESASTLAPGILNVGTFVNFAHNVLPDTQVPERGQIPQTSTLTYGDLDVGYGLNKHLEFGVNFSYVLSQQVDSSSSGAQFSATGFNEVRVGAKYVLLNRAPIGLAVMSSLNFNESYNNPFIGNGSLPTLNVQVAAERLYGKTLVGANLGYRVRSPGKPIEGALFVPLDDQVIGSLAVSRYIPRADLKLIGELYASRATTSVRFDPERQIASEAVVGAKYDITPSLAGDFGVGTRVGDGLFTADWRVYVGLNFNADFSRKAPPPSPLTQKQIEDAHVKYYKGFRPDEVKKMQEQSFDDLAKEHEFALRTTIPDPNSKDPKPPFEVIRLSSFNFDKNSAAIRKEYGPLLDQLTAYLARPPRVMKLQVEGHTDSYGSADLNRRLSQARANALRAYLIRHMGKMAPDVIPMGYGADRPIADNGNFQGRRENRRVEIRILRNLPPSPVQPKKYEKGASLIGPESWPGGKTNPADSGTSAVPAPPVAPPEPKPEPPVVVPPPVVEPAPAPEVKPAVPPVAPPENKPEPALAPEPAAPPVPPVPPPQGDMQ